MADRGYDVLGDLRDLLPARPAGPTDPARASYDERIDILNGALPEAVAELGRLWHLAPARERGSRLERKRRKLGRRPSEAG